MAANPNLINRVVTCTDQHAEALALKTLEENTSFRRLADLTIPQLMGWTALDYAHKLSDGRLTPPVFLTAPMEPHTHAYIVGMRQNSWRAIEAASKELVESAGIPDEYMDRPHTGHFFAEAIQQLIIRPEIANLASPDSKDQSA